MKKFNFRLQTALEQRERLETLAQQSLADAEHALRRGEEFLAELQEVRAALLTELCSRREGVFDMHETRLYQEYMHTIAQSIREQAEYLRDLISTREAHKFNLIQAAQNRQALDTVRERDRQAHTLHGQRREQSALDELATSRFNHRLGLQE